MLVLLVGVVVVFVVFVWVEMWVEWLLLLVWLFCDWWLVCVNFVLFVFGFFGYSSLFFLLLFL